MPKCMSVVLLVSLQFNVDSFSFSKRHVEDTNLLKSRKAKSYTSNFRRKTSIKKIKITIQFQLVEFS